MKNKILESKKNKTAAVASFIFGLAFWIPLLNLIFGLLAICLGIRAIIRIRQKPYHFGGKWFAIAGLTLGILVYLTYFTGLGMCLYGYKDICKNIGLSFLS